MVRFVRQHVTQHFRANRPRPGPAVSMKFLDSPPAAQRFRQHLRATRSALGQPRSCLLRRAARVVELSRKLQMRRGKPHPFAANVVHMGKDRRNTAGLAGRFCFPRAGVKIFDHHLVHALIDGKNLCGGWPQSSLISVNRLGVSVCRASLLGANCALTSGHGSLPRPAILSGVSQICLSILNCILVQGGAFGNPEKHSPPVQRSISSCVPFTLWLLSIGRRQTVLFCAKQTKKKPSLSNENFSRIYLRAGRGFRLVVRDSGLPFRCTLSNAAQLLVRKSS